MKILGSPIIGKNFRCSGLTLTDKALVKRVVVGNKSHDIFLTSDISQICSLMDIKLEDLTDVPIEKAYQVLIDSPYFKTSVFLENNSDSKQLEEFKEFVIIREFKSEYIPIRTTRVEEILGINLSEEVKNTKYILENAIPALSTKYGGKHLLPYLGDYNVRNFSRDFPKFKNSFNSEFEFFKFIVGHSIEEIAEKFLEVSKS